MFNGTSASISRLASDSCVGWKGVWAPGGGSRNAYLPTLEWQFSRVNAKPLERLFQDVVDAIDLEGGGSPTAVGRLRQPDLQQSNSTLHDAAILLQAIFGSAALCDPSLPFPFDHGLETGAANEANIDLATNVGGHKALEEFETHRRGQRLMESARLDERAVDPDRHARPVPRADVHAAERQRRRREIRVGSDFSKLAPVPDYTRRRMKRCRLPHCGKTSCRKPWPTTDGSLRKSCETL